MFEFHVSFNLTPFSFRESLAAAAFGLPQLCVLVHASMLYPMVVVFSDNGSSMAKTHLCRCNSSSAAMSDEASCYENAKDDVGADMLWNRLALRRQLRRP